MFAVAVGALVAYGPSLRPASPIARACVAPVMFHGDLDLETFLREHAGISPKFMSTVLSLCDEEMIGSVANLRTLAEAGMLSDVFKPVIAASIKAALEDFHETELQQTALESSALSALSLGEVRSRLMVHGQNTWASEKDLRRKLTMFEQQERLEGGAQWDSSTGRWVGGTLPLASALSASVVSASPVAAASSARAVVSTIGLTPASTANQAPKPSPAATAVTSPSPSPSPPPSPAPSAPPSAPAPPGFFKVTMQTPDGDLVAHVPPDVYLLDYTDELAEENEAFAQLPYACRAGSCSACAAKVISGEVDNSDSSFLSKEQKSAGFVLTCTTYIKSDTVLQMHAEDNLYD